MLDEFIRSSDVLELCKADLGNDGAELTTRRRNTVRSGPIPGGEGFTRDDEGSGVRPEVLEEVGEAVEHDETILAAALVVVSLSYAKPMTMKIIVSMMNPMS